MRNLSELRLQQVQLENGYDIYEDTGCNEATRFIGKQSECLKCPFAECKEDKLERVYALYNKPTTLGHREALEELLRMRDVEHLSFIKIARRIGVSEPTAQKYYERARQLNE